MSQYKHDFGCHFFFLGQYKRTKTNPGTPGPYGLYHVPSIRTIVLPWHIYLLPSLLDLYRIRGITMHPYAMVVILL